MRKGRISDDEGRTIARLADSLPVEDIAKQLDRSVNSVEEYIKRKLKIGLNTYEIAAYSLEDRPYWIELEAQFTES